jgi:hypothetical protein
MTFSGYSTRPSKKDISVSEEQPVANRSRIPKNAGYCVKPAFLRMRLPLTIPFAMKPSNGCWCFLFGGGIALAAGCGLSEYESKYAKQQERVNYLDEQNRYVGRPIEPPGKKDSPGPTVRLRLPLGISTNFEEETQEILYHYPKAFSKAPQDPKLIVSEIESAYVAVDTTKDWNEFKKRVLNPFEGVDPQIARPVTFVIPGRPARTFEMMSFTYGSDPTWSYRFYFYREDPYRVAIGFRGSEAALASDTAKQAMEYSVKTLMVGPAEQAK